MIITKDFLRFIENASVRELVDRKAKYQEFCRAIEHTATSDYIGEAKAAIRIIDEEMTARCEVADLPARRDQRA